MRRENLLQLLTPKHKKGGVVTNTVIGVGLLIVAVILMYVVVSSITDAELLTESRTTTTTNNEKPAHINATGYQLAGFNPSWSVSPVIVQIRNSTSGSGDGNYNFTILTGNYTVNATGFLTNATTTTWKNVSINYTVENKSVSELSTDRLLSNYSSGVDNISKKIPTILLIVAVVFLFGALVLLVQQARNMGFGSEGSGGI